MKPFIITLLLILSFSVNAQELDLFAPVPEGVLTLPEPELVFESQVTERYTPPTFEMKSQLQYLLLEYYNKRLVEWSETVDDKVATTADEAFTEIETQLEELRECAAFRTTQAFYAGKQENPEKYEEYRSIAENLFGHFSIYAFALQEEFGKKVYDVNAMRQQHFDQSELETRGFIALFTSTQGVGDPPKVTEERNRIITTCNDMEEATDFLNERAAEHLGIEDELE